MQHKLDSNRCIASRQCDHMIWNSGILLDPTATKLIQSKWLKIDALHCLASCGTEKNRLLDFWDRNFRRCGDFLIETLAERVTSGRSLVSEIENNRSKRCFLDNCVFVLNQGSFLVLPSSAAAAVKTESKREKWWRSLLLLPLIQTRFSAGTRKPSILIELLSFVSADDDFGRNRRVKKF